MRRCVVLSATPSKFVSGEVDYEGYSPLFMSPAELQLLGIAAPPTYHWVLHEDSELPGVRYAHPQAILGGAPC